MFKVKLLYFFGVFLILFVLSSCNASLQKASRNSVALPDNCIVANKYCLNTYFDPNSYKILCPSDKEKVIYDNYKDEIVNECSKMLDRSMTNVWGNNNVSIPSGYVICSIKSGKRSIRLWGFAPMIATCCYYSLLGGPLGHANYKREYVFDVYDNSGNLIKTYSVEGKKNQILSLFTTNQQSSIELQAFKSAIQKFQYLYFRDHKIIEASISQNNREIESAMCDEAREERNVAMCSWLDSEILPSDEELLQAVSVAPNDFVGWGLLIEKNIANNNYYEAMQNVERYIELNPTCTIIHPYLLKASLCKVLARDSEALKNAFTAFQMEPDYEPARSLLVNLLIEEGCYSDAIKYVDGGLINNPGNLDYIQIQKNLKNLIAQSNDNIRTVKENEQLMKARALGILANASSALTQNISSIVTPNSTQTSNNTLYNNTIQHRTSQISAKEKSCSLCKGKGWIESFDTSTFDTSTSKYCDECHREVNASHSHKTCPSCKGKGTITTL